MSYCKDCGRPIDISFITFECDVCLKTFCDKCWENKCTMECKNLCGSAVCSEKCMKQSKPEKKWECKDCCLRKTL